MFNRTIVWFLGAGLLVGAVFAAEPKGLLPGENPNPIHLIRPSVQPFSAMAKLGKDLFFDTSLSSSGKVACSSCHSPEHAYGPPNDGPVMLGGPHLTSEGARAVPTLTYLNQQPEFSIGPDDPLNENVNLNAQAQAGITAVRAQKIATQTAQAANIVPQGGLFWDGRANTLQIQARFPLLDPREMDGGSIEIVADKLRKAPYAQKFAQLFGPNVFKDPRMLVTEAMFAIGRYQVEEPSFHPYTSKYDYWLEGKARLSEAEMRGLRLFKDPDKANCAGCHTADPSKDGYPPHFTDFQYEALGAPRNLALTDTKDPNYFDLGVCGPTRKDLADQTQFCGMFKTPTLRNTAVRHAYFHNGVFHTLQQVMDFYDFRDINPEKVYPVGADGKVQKYNDIPAKYQANVDVADPPFNRHPGETPAMTAQDEADIIAFLQTLNDGYKPEQQSESGTN
jgi:cytochrome c peroxidase